VVANLPFMTATLVLTATCLVRVLARVPLNLEPIRSLDLSFLSIIAGAWLTGAGALTIFLTFPAIRYIDTANLLMAPLPVYLAILALAPRIAQTERSKISS
jgi:hypothetical protein